MKLKRVGRLTIFRAIACWKLQRLRPIIVGAASCLLFVACNSETINQQSSLSNCQTVEHDRGKTQICDREAYLKGNRPEQIIAIGPNILELLLALDIQPVGYADYFALPASEFDRPSQQILYLGNRITNQPVNIGSADDPALETIAQLQPDLILGIYMLTRMNTIYSLRLHPRYYSPMG